MKLTPEQKKRLALLHAKTDRNEGEEGEYKALSALATVEGLEINEEFLKAFAAEEEQPEAVSSAELEAVILKAVGDATAKHLNVTELANQVIEAQKANAAITPEALAEILGKAVDATKVDVKALTEALSKGLAPTLSSAVETHVKKNLDAWVASQGRKSSQHEFPVGDQNGTKFFEVKGRSGNLSVAQKQLANICLGAFEASHEAFQNGKGVRPTDQNFGIPADLLGKAVAAGERRNSRLFEGKALTSTGVGSGDEFVPTDLSSDLQYRFYLSSQVAQMMIAQEIDMPTNPFILPLKTTRTPWVLGTEAPASNPADGNPGTSQIVLTTQKLIGTALYSYEVDEDSIIPILPFLQRDLAEGAAASFEYALINGDTTATHMDTDINGVANHPAKAWKGFRKLALAGSLTASWATGGASATNLKALRKLLKKWGVNPSELFMIAGPNAYNDLIGLDETMTADKTGSPSTARILTGVAPSVFGYPIVTSEAMREDLNATGVYDGTTTTKSSVLLVHRPSWYVGVKRQFTVEVDKDIQKQNNVVVASFRRAFVPKETPSLTMPLVAMGINF